MDHEILITTFATWQSHQPSNASDDLLHILLEKELDFFHHLRSIPVDFELSPEHVLGHFDKLKPKVLICCGMAEERTKLNVESLAVRNENILQTGVDLEALTADLAMTEISHDAGGFVCNALYYTMLEHLDALEGEHHCIFIHIPVLTEQNKIALVNDFECIIKRISEMLL